MSGDLYRPRSGAQDDIMVDICGLLRLVVTIVSSLYVSCQMEGVPGD